MGIQVAEARGGKTSQSDKSAVQKHMVRHTQEDRARTMQDLREQQARGIQPAEHPRKVGK